MNALKSFVVFPVVYSFRLIRFTVGLIIVFPFACATLLSDPIAFKKHIDKFAFLSRFPFGVHVFSGIISFHAPYTASVLPTVVSFTSSRCVVELIEYPWLRNPFNSMHAIALANLGELASGLCIVNLLQSSEDIRGIPIRIDTEYYAKARGKITAVGTMATLELDTNCDVQVVAEMFDKSGTMVSKCTVTWRLEIRKSGFAALSAAFGSHK